uniref:Uncharacterized protein n=1 Tax=Vitis vinifera TaxID=29760 RepID=A5ASN1_VITVI|nr:hypothetical protein VITISV_031953 [Vitis vinifera]
MHDVIKGIVGSIVCGIFWYEESPWGLVMDDMRAEGRGEHVIQPSADGANGPLNADVEEALMLKPGCVTQRFLLSIFLSPGGELSVVVRSPTVFFRWFDAIQNHLPLPYQMNDFGKVMGRGPWLVVVIACKTRYTLVNDPDNHIQMAHVGYPEVLWSGCINGSRPDVYALCVPRVLGGKGPYSNQGSLPRGPDGRERRVKSGALSVAGEVHGVDGSLPHLSSTLKSFSNRWMVTPVNI